jgi:hypothetical protein
MQRNAHKNGRQKRKRSLGRPRLDGRTILKRSSIICILNYKKTNHSRNYFCHMNPKRFIANQLLKNRDRTTVMGIEYRKDWNIAHFAEQLVLPPIICFRKYGRIQSRSLSRLKTMTALSDSCVLSRYTRKCNLIYGTTEVRLYLHRFSRNTIISSIMCKVLIPNFTQIG